MEAFFIAILAFFLFLFGMQFVIKFRGRRLRGKPIPEVGGKLGTAIRKHPTVIAYFYSPSCSACRTQEKYLPKVQEVFPHIVRINVRNDMATAQKFQVMGTPTTVIIENGRIKEYFVGVVSPRDLLRAVQG